MELDGAGNAAFVLLGRIGFLHRHPVEQFGREQAEVERARAADAAAIVHARCGIAQHLHAVELGAGEIRAEPAQGDLAALAGIARDRHAGDALERFRQVEIGEGGDVLREDIVFGSDRAALEILGQLQALAIARHDDLGLVVGIALRLVKADGGRCGLRRGHDGRAARRRARLQHHHPAGDRWGEPGAAQQQGERFAGAVATGHARRLLAFHCGRRHHHLDAAGARIVRQAAAQIARDNVEIGLRIQRLRPGRGRTSRQRHPQAERRKSVKALHDVPPHQPHERPCRERRGESPRQDKRILLNLSDVFASVW